MDASALIRMDKIAVKACSRRPRDIADCLRIQVVDACGSIIGFVTRANSLTFAAVNPRLSAVKYDFVLLHEIGHVVKKHLNDPGFLTNGYHQENSPLSVSLSEHTIAVQEKEANLIAADFYIDTPSVLEMVGYNNPSLQQYRELREQLRKAKNEYESTLFSINGQNPTPSLRYHLNELRRLLQKTIYEVRAIESELQYTDCCLTIPEMARELHVSSIIVEYKLEALRIRGYDVEPIEVASYNKVFK